MVPQVVVPIICTFFNCTLVLFNPVIGQLHEPLLTNLGNVTVVLTVPLKVELLSMVIVVSEVLLNV